MLTGPLLTSQHSSSADNTASKAPTEPLEGTQQARLVLTGPLLTAQLASQKDSEEQQPPSQLGAESQHGHADSMESQPHALRSPSQLADPRTATAQSVVDPAQILRNSTRPAVGSGKQQGAQESGISSAEVSLPGSYHCPLDYPELTREGVYNDGHQPYLLGGNGTSCVHCQSTGFISQVLPASPALVASSSHT